MLLLFFHMGFPKFSYQLTFESTVEDGGQQSVQFSGGFRLRALYFFDHFMHCNKTFCHDKGGSQIRMSQNPVRLNTLPSISQPFTSCG